MMGTPVVMLPFSVAALDVAYVTVVNTEYVNVNEMVTVLKAVRFVSLLECLIKMIS